MPLEDISDEEFVELEPRKEIHPEATTTAQAEPLAVNPSFSETWSRNKPDEMQVHKGCVTSASDPIEDFSLGIPNNDSSGRTCAGNLLSSPAKHKRDTERAAGSLGTKEDKQTLPKGDSAQRRLPGHEAETTDLVDEGLMSHTNKKQKALPANRKTDGNPFDLLRDATNAPRRYLRCRGCPWINYFS